MNRLVEFFRTHRRFTVAFTLGVTVAVLIIMYMIIINSAWSSLGEKFNELNSKLMTNESNAQSVITELYEYSFKIVTNTVISVVLVTCMATFSVSTVLLLTLRGSTSRITSKHMSEVVEMLRKYGYTVTSEPSFDKGRQMIDIQLKRVFRR